MLCFRSLFRLLLYTISGISLLHSAFLVHGFLPQRKEPYIPVTRSTRRNIWLPQLLWLSIDTKIGLPDERSKEEILREEAANLLEKAKTLRKELPEPTVETFSTKNGVTERTSKWNVPSTGATDTDNCSDISTGYRLYVDIGREDGTWMDPRWGASQRRIEFTIDVEFQQSTNVTKQQQQCMVQDNWMGRKSPIYNLRVAPFARLRNGFDDMKCSNDNGAYRIDTQNSNQGTVRFYITTDGKTDTSYGDIDIPSGELYFSIPCFGTNEPKKYIRNLSTKDGIVSIRQMGWNTGWRRMESRIVGTFRAIPIDAAKQRDGF